MSTAATKLILHHAYTRGSALDLSEFGNHGLREDTFAASQLPDALEFDSHTSWVKVAPSDTLNDIRALHLRVRFMLRDEPQEGYVRYNLAESDGSFALFVNFDGSLQGTIYDGVTWFEVLSSPGTIRRSVWHDVSFVHDGVSHGRLHVDGAKVAENYAIPGPIRDVGPLGLAIGHWPAPEPEPVTESYTFDGWIDDVRIWVYDPQAEAGPFVDRCCIDREGLDELLRPILTRGTREGARGLARRLLDAAGHAAFGARGSSAAGTAYTANLANAFFAAMSRHQGQRAEEIAGLYAARAMQNAPQPFEALQNELQEVLQQMGDGGVTEVVEKLGLTIEDIARMLCLEWMPHRDPSGIATLMVSGDTRPPRPRRGRRKPGAGTVLDPGDVEPEPVRPDEALRTELLKAFAPEPERPKRRRSPRRRGGGKAGTDGRP